MKVINLELRVDRFKLLRSVVVNCHEAIMWVDESRRVAAIELLTVEAKA